ncbi:zinc finger, CCHC-type containing protein [Tanacetum coccineum]
MKWYHNLRIVLYVKDKLPFLEQSIPAMLVPAEGQVLPSDVLNTHTAWLRLRRKLLKEGQTLPPKEVAPALHAIRAGRIQKNQKKKSHKAAKGNQGKGKAKMGYAPVQAPPFAPKPKNPPTPKKDNPAKDAICHQCGEVGHWRRNCPIYLAELMKKKKLSQGASTSGALSLYVGDGHRATVEAIGEFHLCLPSGLDGFVNRFENDNSISVSRNNLIYFNAVPQDDIYEIVLSSFNTNDSSMYVVSNKRAKLNLDFALLWHCHLGHISK